MATLSVFLTNYNDGHVVGRAIEAIATQSRKPDEFIIQDDGSSDNSAEIIASYARRYPFIKFVRNERNLGAIPAMQKAASLTTGEYIYGCAADDYVLPGFIEKSMALLEQYPQAGLCTGNLNQIVEETRQQWVNEVGFSETPSYLPPALFAEKVCGFPIFGHCTITKRSAFLEAGGFLSDLKWHADWFYNLVIAFRQGVCYMPEALVMATTARPGSYCYEGMKDLEVQTEVLAVAIRLLKSSAYRDVLPGFIRGNVLASFGFYAARAVMLKPDLWDTESFLLAQYPLQLWNNSVTQARAQRAAQAEHKAAIVMLKKCEQAIGIGNLDEIENIVLEISRVIPNLPEATAVLAKITATRSQRKN